jgi:hypothetical protein
MNPLVDDRGIAAVAPLALFVFRRPEHTRRTLAALATNPGFEQTPLVVYCDGARRPADAAAVAEVRRIVHSWPHPRKTVIEATANRGLANSIIEGVDSLCHRHGAVIVVEDDLIVEPGFLDYMQSALRRYAHDPRLMQVSGYMFPLAQPDGRASTLLPMTTSWGWATWRRAWQHFDPTAANAARLASSMALRYRFDLDGSYPYFDMLQRQLRGETDSWAIRWYLSVFLADGLVLYPGRTLVRNTTCPGWIDCCDRPGSHCRCGSVRRREAPLAARPRLVRACARLAPPTGTGQEPLGA